MIFIFTVDHCSLRCRQDIDVPRPQPEDGGSAHGVFVKVEPDLAHRRFESGANCCSQRVAADSSCVRSASISAWLA